MRSTKYQLGSLLVGWISIQIPPSTSTDKFGFFFRSVLATSSSWQSQRKALHAAPKAVGEDQIMPTSKLAVAEARRKVGVAAGNYEFQPWGLKFETCWKWREIFSLCCDPQSSGDSCALHKGCMDAASGTLSGQGKGAEIEICTCAGRTLRTKLIFCRSDCIVTVVTYVSLAFCIALLVLLCDIFVLLQWRVRFAMIFAEACMKRNTFVGILSRWSGARPANSTDPLAVHTAALATNVLRWV